MGEMHCGSAAAMQERNVEGGKLMGGNSALKTYTEKTQVQKTGVPHEFSQGTPAVNYLVNFADLSTD